MRSAWLGYKIKKNMREIKFKAVKQENGGWVYGLLFNTNKDHHSTPRTSIITENYDPYGYGSNEFVEVNPDTVCQFIGFTDRNGKEIFEGDIIQYDYFGDEGELKYSNMQIFWNGKAASFCYDDSYKSDKSSYQELNEDFCKDIIVVGNVHENIELLAVSEADA